MKSMRYSYLQARNMVWSIFKEIHPKETWPDWLENCLYDVANINSNNNWVFRIMLQPQPSPPAGMHYELIENEPVLVTYDKETGEKRIVISGGSALENVVLFEVEIDGFHGSKRVTLDRGISGLDKRNYVQIKSTSETVDDITEYHISIKPGNAIDMKKLRFISKKVDCNLICARQVLQEGIKNIYQGKAQVIREIARELENAGIIYEIVPSLKCI